MPNKKEKRGRGQPTKYDPSYCQLLIDHMSAGGLFGTFAKRVSVDRKTLYAWLKQHEEFAEAKAIADAHFLDFMWEQFKAGLWIDKGGPAFNTTAWIFAMKNCCGWRDRVDTNQNIRFTPEEVKEMTIEQLKLEAAKIIEAEDDDE